MVLGKSVLCHFFIECCCFPRGICYQSVSSHWPIKGPLLVTFFASPPILMEVPIPSFYRCPGRSFLAPESVPKAASQSEPDGVLRPAGKDIFASWTSNGISYRATPVCDLPTRDLMPGGPIGFRLLTNEPSLKQSFLGETALDSTPRSWRRSNHPTFGFLHRGSASLCFGRLLCAVSRLFF